MNRKGFMCGIAVRRSCSAWKLQYLEVVACGRCREWELRCVEVAKCCRRGVWEWQSVVVVVCGSASVWELVLHPSTVTEVVMLSSFYFFAYLAFFTFFTN